MGNFRQLSESVWASPQIATKDVIAAKELGITLIVNNRPDGESHDQPAGEEIEEAAKQAGIGYLSIPITHAGFSMPQVDAMAEALQADQGGILAYCRSGTRSTLLWALAQAKLGADPDKIANAARNAGYDVSPVRGTIDMLSSNSG